MTAFSIYEAIDEIKAKFNVRFHSKKDGSVPDTVEGRKNWTWAIKKAFIELGDHNGYKVCTACNDGQHADLKKGNIECVEWGEWLYDLVWYTDVIYNAPLTTRTLSVPLVVECEWDNSISAIAMDFDKLLVANADLRVLVCSAYNNFPAQHIIDYCEAAVRGYEQGRKGDCFLLCIMDGRIVDGKKVTLFHTIVKIQ
ncbi:MAG: hypothetical protein KA408_00370 [Flavobacteriales bacterium]|nr:hypothetical protein [Flavobacteriales bacterium]